MEVGPNLLSGFGPPGPNTRGDPICCDTRPRSLFGITQTRSEKPYVRKHHVVRCYKCGMSGHRSFECESKVESQPNKKITCFNCNKQGHFSNECPEKSSKDKQKGGKGKGKKEQ